MIKLFSYTGHLGNNLVEKYKLNSCGFYGQRAF